MNGRLAGAVAILLFAAGGIVLGERPAFESSGAELAAWFGDEGDRIQVTCLLNGVSAALLVWFLVTVASTARSSAGTLALAAGLGFMTLFLADNIALAVGALRPVEDPELAAALVDFELLAMGMAAPLVTAMLLGLGRSGVWGGTLSRLAYGVAALYAMRAATLFTLDGVFAADGVLGFWLPVASISAWTCAASIAFWRKLPATDTA